MYFTFEMLILEKRARVILTDSENCRKEPFSFGALQEKTELVEMDAGRGKYTRELQLEIDCSSGSEGSDRICLALSRRSTNRKGSELVLNLSKGTDQ